MRNVKQFKSNMKKQRNRLHELGGRLDGLRDRYGEAGSASQRNRLERDANLVKEEMENINRFLERAERAAYDWINTTDAEINALAEFKYWKRD